ncbi:MAG TPA: hypothetical protein VEZ11_04920 [Thermoanaerobaculia bacterium]|nr:hypothetical protein [Thermoanaerobaculia bacterium]
MKRAVAFAVCLFAVALGAAAQPTCSSSPQLSYGATQAANLKVSVWSIDFIGCTNVPAFTPNAPITILLGTTSFTGTVLQYSAGDPNALIGQNPFVTFTLPNSGTSTTDAIEAQYKSSTATLQVGGKNIALALTEPLNVRQQSFQFGPATAGDTTGGGGSPSSGSSQAFRFQYSGTYTRRPPFSSRGDRKSTSLWNRFEKDVTLSIDTTDQKTGFVDNNSFDAGLYLPGLSIQSVLAQGRVGVDAKYSRGIHSPSPSNLDVTGAFSGWLPFLQTINIMPKGAQQRGSPASLALQYGYRSQRTTGSSTTGATFTGSAGYHFYVIDSYRVDFTTTTTWTEKPASGLPHTQHDFKAQILYASSPTSKFNIATSVENGSISPVARKVRNYFIGVALSQVFESRAGGNQ